MAGGPVTQCGRGRLVTCSLDSCLVHVEVLVARLEFLSSYDEEMLMTFSLKKDTSNF